jgi:hypothetical protein
MNNLNKTHNIPDASTRDMKVVSCASLLRTSMMAVRRAHVPLAPITPDVGGLHTRPGVQRLGC